MREELGESDTYIASDKERAMVNQKFGLAPVQFTATEKNVILAADRAANRGVDRNRNFARQYGRRP